jgi:hypothetical protein
MVQQLEDVISDDDDAFLNRYVYICFEGAFELGFILTEVPRDSDPKDIVPCYSRQNHRAHLQQAAIKF